MHASAPARQHAKVWKLQEQLSRCPALRAKGDDRLRPCLPRTQLLVSSRMRTLLTMDVQSDDEPGHVEKERQEQRFGHVRRALAAAKQDEREGRSWSVNKSSKLG